MVNQASSQFLRFPFCSTEASYFLTIIHGGTLSGRRTATAVHIICGITTCKTSSGRVNFKAVLNGPHYNYPRSGHLFRLSPGWFSWQLCMFHHRLAACWKIPHVISTSIRGDFLTTAFNGNIPYVRESTGFFFRPHSNNSTVLWVVHQLPDDDEESENDSNMQYSVQTKEWSSHRPGLDFQAIVAGSLSNGVLSHNTFIRCFQNLNATWWTVVKAYKYGFMLQQRLNLGIFKVLPLWYNFKIGEFHLSETRNKTPWEGWW